VGYYDWLGEIDIDGKPKDRTPRDGQAIKGIPDGRRIEEGFKDVSNALKHIKNTGFTGKLFLMTSTEKISFFYKAGKQIGGVSISRLGAYSKAGEDAAKRNIHLIPSESVIELELFEYGRDDISKLTIKFPHVLTDSYLLSLEDWLEEFYKASDFNTKKILEVILFSETHPSKDVLRVVFMSSIFAELQSDEFEAAITSLEENGIIEKREGRFVISDDVKRSLKQVLMNNLAGEDEIKEMLTDNPQLTVFFKAAMERGGKITHDELRVEYKNKSNEDIKDMVDVISKRNAVMRGLNGQGIPMYVVPPDLLTFASRVEVEVPEEVLREGPVSVNGYDEHEVHEHPGTPLGDSETHEVTRDEIKDMMDGMAEPSDEAPDDASVEEPVEAPAEGPVEELGDVPGRDEPVEVVNRDEILKKLRIRDPTEEDIDSLLESVMEDTSSADSMVPLMDALKDKDPMVRNVAVSAIGKLRDMRAVDPLIDALKDEDTAVRINVCKSLGALGDFKAIKPLVDSLNDQKIGVRIAACGALGSFGSPDVIHPILDALKDEDSGVRSQACKALGALGDVVAIEPLLLALKDSDNIVRRDATTALSGFKDERIVLPLIEALEDDDAYVRRVATSALWRTGDDRVVGPLVKRLKDEDSMVRYCVVSAFDSKPDERVIEPLIESLKDEDNMVRTVAASALGKIKDAKAYTALEGALNDEDEWVRNCAKDALENLKSLEDLET